MNINCTKGSFNQIYCQDPMICEGTRKIIVNIIHFNPLNIHTITKGFRFFASK